MNRVTFHICFKNTSWDKVSTLTVVIAGHLATPRLFVCNSH